MEQHSRACSVEEGRGEARTNMFIAAMVQTACGSAPARIRNLSSNGAMIESSLLFAPGAEVRLVRGARTIRGTVVWSVDGRCGLRLSPAIRVADWLASPTNAEQGRVDAAVSLIKAGAAAGPMRQAGEVAGLQPGAMPAQLTEDLRSACLLIEALGDELVADATVLAAHAGRLQLLDIATQIVMAVAGCLEPRGASGAEIGRLEGLRASCRQALLARDC